MSNNNNKNQSEPSYKSRSVFDLPPNFFDSCRLFHHNESSYLTLFDNDSFEPSTTTTTAINEEQVVEEEKVFVPRWSCNTCKVEFESLDEQRSHFKSDFHRFNVKLTIVGKTSIKEEDFDESASDSLFRDNDISSISGSEDDEVDKASFLSIDTFKKSRGSHKQKLFIRLSNGGEVVSLWKCLLMDESEMVSHGNDDGNGVGGMYLREYEVVQRLKFLIHEPRDKSKLRIVLLASGGHFVGCVFDGNSVIAHKTFHRYVVRAKAGKKQSSKDASGKAASSAGASLRRYNEFALKKEIQELLAAWKSYFDTSSCIYISATSNNRQLLYNAEGAYFSHSNSTVRHVPFTVRRPTFKEAKRIYNHMTNMVYVDIEKISESSLSGDSVLVTSDPGSGNQESNQVKLDDNQPSTETAEACRVNEDTDRTESDDVFGTSTPLHDAAKAANSQQTLELLEQGLDPCIIDERGRTPYMLASDKEVRNTFRRFMALNLDRWDWNAAKVPSPLTKEMEESQAAKQAEKDAKRKAKAKELKKLRKAKEKAQLNEQTTRTLLYCCTSIGIPLPKQHLPRMLLVFAHSQRAIPGIKTEPRTSKGVQLSKEEELKMAQVAEREKRAAAAEKRIAAAAALSSQGTSTSAVPSSSELPKGAVNDLNCSCCNVSLSGKVPFHRYHYNYCSTSCMHVHREMLEDG
ncbi:hypothetical protein IFM89_019792 [Coptis chinensis]|uniref:VLRF1 domain-containing protein n=1 Tax=Coptis chinensis TaxID=261450 RepID=A0A835M5J4_9MAGN|nr:hypothetical protein IFM89_019792 [Coptis chinensis]